MIEKIVILVVLLFFFITPSTGQRFDSMKLVLQWPISYCNNYGNQGCGILPIPQDDFKIHGLWHSMNGEYVQFCGTHDLTRNDLRSDLIDQLREEWPSLKGDDFKFWRSQWSKHGLCHGTTPAEYFQTALFLKFAYAHNILQELGNKGV
ncbi:hypothetical protein Patl1_21901 [Pistacia atlantica]|uniref:Uncharacterized protein n=1 Tax=Pistacia atlantica TaxID=434234 RepID=A0ACC1BK83_9ROSI|nr:hypothetical protein Patl1_21901 [Pistacia atlantica]